MENNFV